MGKLTNLNNLVKLSEALDVRYKELINEEKARAIAEEQALQSEIDITKEMFGGKSIRYITQVEYDALTEEERNSDTVTYFITDAVDLSHEHENKEFLDGLSQEVLDSEYIKAVDFDNIIYNDMGTDIMEKITYIEDTLEKTQNVLIEEYSEYAIDNDYSNVIEYIMDNVVDETRRTVINFQPGKDYIINAKINKRNITLTGNANIIGKLEVGLDDLNQNDTNNPWYDSMMHCIIDGLSFVPTMYFPDYWKYDNHGIWLYNARSVTIRNCYFANMVYPIYIRRCKDDKFVKQHSHRINVVNCNFMCVDYNLYGEDYTIERTTDTLLEIGDVNFQGNMCEETKTANICLGGIDGFSCYNNIFFLEKEHGEGNINLYYTVGVNIVGNRIFEPGTSSINLYRTQDVIIDANHMFNSGYKDKSAAIRIEMGVWFESDTGICAVISNNIMRNCNGPAIEIVNNINEYGCSNYIINTNYMYLQDTTENPVLVNGYSLGVVITNNVSNVPINVKNAQFAVADYNAISDISGTCGNDNIWTQWINNGGDVNMDLQYLGANQEFVDTTDAATIITINEPSDKTLIREFTNLIIKSKLGNTTIKHTTFINTRIKSDLVLGENELALFSYVSGKFYQIN